MQRPASLRWVPFGAAIGVAATAAILADNNRPAAGWERSVADAVYDLPAPATGVLEAIMQAGTRGAIVVAAIALFALGRRHQAAVTAVAGIGAWLLSQIVKELIARPRPTDETLGRAVRGHIDGFGFTSTHTAIAAALAVALATMNGGWTLPVALTAIAIATAVARVHLGVHWPLDVIGGAGIGVACGIGARSLVPGGNN